MVEEVTSSYSKAKTASEIARENLAAVEAKSGASKEEIQAAEAAVAEAKYAEIAAGQAYVSNTGLASAISQKQTLENLKAIRSTPGMNKWDVRRTEAAIKAAEAQIAGKSFNYEATHLARLIVKKKVEFLARRFIQQRYRNSKGSWKNKRSSKFFKEI